MLISRVARNLLLILIAFAGGCSFCFCGLGDELIPSQSRYNFASNSAIIQVAYFGTELQEIGSGNMIVFLYDYSSRHCARRTDDEFGKQIYFQVDPNQESFDFQDEELTDANCYAGTSGFMVSAGPQKVTKGRITGKKISPDKYNVRACVEISDQRSWSGKTTIRCNGVFNKTSGLSLHPIIK